MNFAYRPTPGSQGLSPALLQMLLSAGVMQLPKAPREPRRWQLREAGKLPPHTHAQEKARRLKQLARIDEKDQIRAAFAAKTGFDPGRWWVRQELRKRRAAA